jgi:hypothetical protein
LPAIAASIADHDRPYAGAVAAVVITIAVAVPIAVAIVFPEYAPITITIAIIVVVATEAARLAEAVIANPAAYTLDLLDDAELVLRRRNPGRTGEIDRVGAVGQQRGAGDGYGGGQRHQQELVHFGSSSLSAVMAWKSRVSKPEICPDQATLIPPEEGTKFHRHVTLAAKRTRFEGGRRVTRQQCPRLRPVIAKHQA